MSLLILSAADVAKVVSSFDTEFLQELMARVFIALSSTSLPLEDSDIQIPHRVSVDMPSHVTLFMPARVSFPRVALKGTSIKIVSIPCAEGVGGLPATTLVLNEGTGAVEAVINARELTALRNAAGSLLSMTLVGIHDPEHIVMFGAGKQIEAHINLFLRHCPSIKSCTIINRSVNERAQTLYRASQAAFSQVAFQLLSSHDSGPVQRTVQQADVIICATSSTSPLFPSSWVSSGTHVVLIGSFKPIMREVEEQLIRRALPTNPPHLDHRIGRVRINQILMVDSRAACAKEAGDLIQAGVGQESMVEIGELLLHDGDRPLSSILSRKLIQEPTPAQPPSFTGPITIFKSVGVGLQDVVLATEVVCRAGDIPGVGTRIDQYDTTA